MPMHCTHPLDALPPFCARTLHLGSRCFVTQLFPIVHQATAAAAQANLLRQQEELEKKAAELDRKEQELQNRPGGHISKL